MDAAEFDAVSSIKKTIENFDGKFAKADDVIAMQRQLDAIDGKLTPHHSASIDRKSLGDLLRESDQMQRLLTDKRGTARLNLSGSDAALMSTKTVLTSSGAGYSTAGVMGIDRIPGITADARPQLTIRDVLSARQTALAIIDFVKVSVPLAVASPVAEAALKPENAITFVAASERVRTLATWLPASRQILDDFEELTAFLQSSLAYSVDRAEEIELLAGDATGEHLHGILSQAAAFNPAVLPPAYTRLDIIGAAVAQIAVANELAPTFCVVNPRDWWGLRMTKDAYGRYILGDPQNDVGPRIFGLSAVVTSSISPSTFLVGSGSAAAAEIVDRMSTLVEISTEHQDYFTKNLIAIRAEKRLALIVKRPASFVTGTLNSSPVS